MSDCIEWTGKFYNGGPRVYDEKKHRYVSALRKMWEEVNGPVEQMMRVKRTCGNSRCVNLEHCVLRAMGWAMGSLSKSAKLTNADIRDIREAYASGGITQRELGKAYGVTQVTISCIIRRKTWAHV